jgi:malate permease and related proteins
MLSGVIFKILPVILIFVLGYFLKIIQFLNKENAALFLKVVFYISLPALILLSVSEIKLSPDLIFLPLITILVMVITYGVSYGLGKLLHLEKKVMGVFLIGTIIMNTLFSLPFILAAYGEEGLSRMMIFDFGNALLVFTFVYSIACKYGDQGGNSKMLLKKLASSSPIWALFIAIILNLADIRIHPAGINFLKIVGNLTIPLAMLSLGIYFNPKIVRIVPLSYAVMVRMLFGFLLGVIFVKMFNLEGLNRQIVIIGSSVPSGYATLTFSAIENLDAEFASSLVSTSVLIGIFLIPALILFLS